MKYTLFAAVAFALLTGCSSAPPPVVDNREADAKAIRAVEETVAKGWDAHDGAMVASAYAPTADFMIGNMPTVKGADIPTALKDMIADPKTSLKFTNIRTEVAKSGDVGFTQGIYTVILTDTKTKKLVTEKGRYVSTFMKTAGNWKIVSDIATPDSPAVPVAAAKRPAPAKSAPKAKAKTAKKKAK